MPKSSQDRHCYPYERPSLTADAVIWTIRDRRWTVLLIERRSEPFADCWALPGGFVEPNEQVNDAARRELSEEAGIACGSMHIIGCFGGPNRDPRGWTVSGAYYSFVSPNTMPRAGSDASRFAWHSMNRLPKLAFDHRDILKSARSCLIHDCCVVPVLAPVLPTRFTSEELHTVYSAIDPKRFADAAKLKAMLMATGVIQKSGPTYRWKRFSKIF
jgi:8-oxo-dGTP diphosphatase